MNGNAFGWGFAVMVGVAGLVSGCATAPVGQSTGPRAVTLVQSETSERVSVTYWGGTAYDQAAMARISNLMRDRRTGEVIAVDPKLIDFVVEVRDNLGLGPETPIVVTSGYRSPATNAALARTSSNVAENSYHIRGRAADFHIDGVPAKRIAEIAASLHRGGYAAYTHTGHVHLDTGPDRTWSPKGSDWPPRGGIIEVRNIVRQPPAPPPGTPAPPVPAEIAVAEARPAPITVAPITVATAPEPPPAPVRAPAPAPVVAEVAPAPAAPVSVPATVVIDTPPAAPVARASASAPPMAIAAAPPAAPPARRVQYKLVSLGPNRN